MTQGLFQQSQLLQQACQLTCCQDINGTNCQDRLKLTDPYNPLLVQDMVRAR